MAEFKKPTTDEEVDKMIKLILFYKNPYDVLYADPSMPVETIKSHYRKLAMWFHPDHCKHEKSTDVLTALKKAMETLEKPESRQPFDEVHEEAVKAINEKWEKNGRKIPQEGEDQSEYLYDIRKATHTMILTLEERMKRAGEIAKSNMEFQEEIKKEHRDQLKQLEEDQKKWDEGRDERIGDWKRFSATRRKPGSLKRPLKKAKIDREGKKIKEGGKEH